MASVIQILKAIKKSSFHKKIYLFFLLLSSSTLIGCQGSILCTKGDTNQGLFFHYGKTLGRSHVDIGSSPTLVSDASWVKKLIVEENGFLAVTGQKTIICADPKKTQNSTKAQSDMCRERKMVEKYTAHRYMEGKGYEEWTEISTKEWEDIQSLDHRFFTPPKYFYKNCRYKAFAYIHQLMGIVRRL